MSGASSAAIRSNAGGSIATASTSSAPKRNACLSAWKPSRTVSSGSRRAVRKRTVRSCSSRPIRASLLGERSLRQLVPPGRLRQVERFVSATEKVVDALDVVPAGKPGGAALAHRCLAPQSLDDLCCPFGLGIGQEDEEL